MAGDLDVASADPETTPPLTESSANILRANGGNGSPPDGTPHVMEDESIPSYHQKGKGKAIDPATVKAFQLTDLPAELVNLILSFLDPVDIANIGRTCRHLYEHAEADHLWQTIVQANVPGVRVSTPYPCASFKGLYAVHDQRWFLPEYKIWFSDREFMGRVVLVRYDPRRGCIEGYQLTAFNDETTEEPWLVDNDVTISMFQPDVKLLLDKPILQLDAESSESSTRRSRRPPAIRIIRRGDRDVEASGSDGPSKTSGEADSLKPNRRFQAEIPMHRGSSTDGYHSNFMLAKPLMPSFAIHRASFPFPYGDVWPPPAIPASQHVAGVTLQMFESSTSAMPHRPSCRAEVSDHAFRIRSWVELGGSIAARNRERIGNESTTSWAAPVVELFSELPATIHIGEEVATYATLDPALYTPTREKPWRGIWVGDYSVHGCEFLLFNQPDDPHHQANADDLVRLEDETEERFEQRKTDHVIYRGRLEAIKLTGDNHVPVGEYSFMADDLGDGGYVTTCQAEPFIGARVVKSKGHIANPGFEDDRYIESQLILISPNRIAQYWLGFAHISFFERVNIDDFITPS